jgi:hypothetical protein
MLSTFNNAYLLRFVSNTTSDDTTLLAPAVDSKHVIGQVLRGRYTTGIHEVEKFVCD